MGGWAKALKGIAAEILDTMPASCRNNYDLMVALQRKFGDERKREVYRMELRRRAQKANESLQAFVVEVERLVQLIYPLKNHPLIGNFKTEAFVNGIHNPDIKLAVCSTQKSTFAKTSKQSVKKWKSWRKNAFKINLKRLKQVLEDNGQKAKLKCFNCGKAGHFQRNYKAARRRLRCISPARNNKRTNYHLSTQESPLKLKRGSTEERMLAPTSNGSTTSISVMWKTTSILRHVGT